MNLNRSGKALLFVFASFAFSCSPAAGATSQILKMGFPVTDNLLLFAVGGGLLVLGWRRKKS